MRFSDFANIARHHPIRIEAARRIRALHGTARDGFNVRIAARAEQQRRSAEWKVLRDASPWASPNAVGCVETGSLFKCPHEAAAKMGLIDRAVLIRRSANDGRAVRNHDGWPATVRFVWLNKRRWRELTVWDSPFAVGCVQTGELFASSSEAARMMGVAGDIRAQDIWAAAQRGGTVRERWSFVWLDMARRRAAEEWRRRNREQRQHTRHTRRKEAEDESRDWCEQKTRSRAEAA